MSILNDIQKSFFNYRLTLLVILGCYHNFMSQVSVTATSATTGPTTYTTVSAAFAAINSGTHKGDITINIEGNTTEPGSSTALIRSGAGFSSYTSILIRPKGGNFSINGTATANRAIIELNGADNVTINGDDPLIPGTRNLTIGFTSTSATVAACIRVSSESTTPNGSDNNTIKNCIIVGNRQSGSMVATYGINMSNYSTASLATGGIGSKNNMFENNLITRCFYGIWAVGSSTTSPNTGTKIIKNTLGDGTVDNNIGGRGVLISRSAVSVLDKAAVISDNEIMAGDPGTAGYNSAVAGIELGANNLGIQLFNNNIHDIKQPYAGAGAAGIIINTLNSNVSVYNNFIRDITANNYSTNPAVAQINHGILITGGGTMYLDHNTIVMKTANPVGTLSNPASSCISITSTAVSIASLRNNILVNTNNSTNAYCIYTSTATNISNANMDNNDYFVQHGTIGFYDGVALSTFSAWKNATGKDLLSFNINPVFMSATDLHLDGSVPSVFESSGAVLSILSDIDGHSRPGPVGSINGGGSLPDIGADEFDGLPFVYVNFDTVVVSPSGSVCNASQRLVSAQIIAGSIPINTAKLNYSFNGVAQSPISMTNTLGDTWQATIPLANPSNAIVTWSITVEDDVTIKTIEGLSYQDNPLYGINLDAKSALSIVCQGTSTNLTVAPNSIFEPDYYQPNQIPNETINENIGNVTISKNGTSVLNNSTLLGSLNGTIGMASGTNGSYSDFTSYGPYSLIAGQSYDFSLSSIQGDSVRGNSMAIYIDYNRNGSFDDSVDIVYVASNTTSGAHTETGTFTIPSTAFNGLTRMRIILNEGVISNPSMIINNGEYEDYLLNISSSNHGGGGGIPMLSYAWSDGIINLGNGALFNATITKNTLFSVRGETFEGCSIQATISVLNRPFLISAGADQIVCRGSSVVLNGFNAMTYSWDNGVINQVPFVPLITKTYSVSGIDTNGCYGTDQVLVNVNQLPVVHAGLDQSICIGSAVTLHGSGTSIYSWNNGVADSESFIPLETKNYVFSGTDTNGCVNYDTVLVEVNPLPIVTAGTDQTICQGSPIILTGSGANTYSWNKNVVNAIPFQLQNTDTFTVVGTDLKGCVDTDQVIVKIDPIPISGIIYVNDNSGYTVCKGGSKTLNVSGYVGTIQWQSTNSMDDSWIDVEDANISQHTFNNINTNTWYRSRVKSGVCPQKVYSESVKISPRVLSGSITGDNKVCYENTGTTLTLEGSSGTIQWQKSTNWSSVNSTWQNITSSQNSLPTGVLLMSTAYRAILSGNSCPNDTSAIFTLEVIPKAVGGIISVLGSNGIAVCKGDSKTLSVIGNVGSIQWQTLSNDNTWTDVSGETSTSCTFSTVTSSKSYRVLANTLSGICPSASSNTIQFSIIEPPVSTSINGLVSRLCYGSATSLTLTSGYKGTILWQKSTNWNVSNPTWTSVTGSSPTLATGTLNSSTAFRVMLSNNPCPAVSTANFVVSVDPLAVSGNIVSDESCLGNSLSMSLSGYVGSSIQWQSSSTASGTFSNIDGATSSTYITPALVSNSNKHFKAIVTSGVCNTKATSPIKSIVVSPLSVAGTISGTTTVCPGGGGTLTITGQTGTIQWQYSRNGILFYDVPTATSDTVSTFSTTSANGNATTYEVNGLTTTIFFRAKVTSGVCSSVYTTSKQFIVKNSATKGTVTGVNQICVTGNTGTNLTLSGYEGTITWQKSSNWTAASPVWTSLTGTSSVLATGVLTAGDIAYRASVTIGSCSIVNTNPFVISVYAAAIAGTITANDLNGSTVCSGSNKSLKVSGNIGTIQWQYSTSSATTGFSDVFGAQGISQQTFQNITVNTWFRVVVTSGTCVVKQTSAVFAVTPKQPTISGSISGLVSTICASTGTTLSLVGSSGTILWQKSTNWAAASPTWSNLTGTTSTLSTGNLTISTAYRAVVSNNPCPASTTTNFVVNVDPIPVGGTIVSENNNCIGSNVTFNLSGYTGSSIQWQTSSVSSGPFTDVNGETGISYTINNISLTTNKYYKAVVTSGVCVSKATSALKIITVNPFSIAGSIVGGGIICPNAGGTISLSGNTGSVQWQYSPNGTNYFNVPSSTSDTVSLFNTTSLNGNSSNYIVTGVTGNVYFRTKVTSGACSSTYTSAKQFIVKNAATAGIISGLNELCITGNNGTTLTLAGSEGSITWQKSTNWTAVSPTWTAISGATGNTYATGVLTTSNTAYRASVTIGSCSTVFSPIHTLKVYAAAVAGTAAVNDASGLTVCSGGSKALKLTGNTGTIQWQSSANATGPWADVTDAQTTPFTFTNIGGNTWYRALVTSGICPTTQTSNVLAISVKQPTVSGEISSLTSTICSGTATSLSLTGSSGTIQWQKSTNWTAATPTWTSVTGITNSLSTGNLTASTAYRAILSNSPCPTSTTSLIAITVNPAVVTKIISANVTSPSGSTAVNAICLNSTVTKTLTLGAGYVGTIQWQKASTSTGPFSDIAAANASSFTIVNPLAGATYYRVKLSSGVCSDGFTSPVVVYYKNCLISKAIETDSTSQPSDQFLDASLYPNPFEESCNLFISNVGNEMVMVRIYNLEGELLEEIESTPAELTEMKLGNQLARGVYVVHIVQGNRQKKLRVVKN